MYVSSGSACTERNSQTPMDPAAITRQNNRIARMGNRFVRGNVALNTLVQTLGGVGIGDNVPGVTELVQAADFRNSPSCSSSILGDGSLYGGRIANGSQGPGLDEGGAFLPVSMGGNVVGSVALPGSPSLSSAPTDAGASAAAIAAMGNPTSAVPVPTSGAAATPQGSAGPGGLSWNFNTRGRKPGQRCPPQLLPMMSVFPIPATWSTRGANPGSVGLPGATPPPGVQPAGGSTGPGSNAPAPVGAVPPRPTTGNICLDLVLNYALDKQVSQAQITRCQQLNYMGTVDGPLLTAAYETWRNNNYNSLPMIPDQANVPPWSNALGKPWGLEGLGDDGSGCMCLVLVALAVAGGVWWAYEERKGR
jgi:hypothetical protein